MNVVFCDKRDCVFWDVDGICNCVMHDGIPYCKSESIDTEKDAADGLREENATLREESSKYRDLYVHAIADAEVWHLQWSAEHQENTKLRELVRDMWNGMCARAECRHCEHYELNDGQRFVGECEFHKRMREFGIKVD